MSIPTKGTKDFGNQIDIRFINSKKAEAILELKRKEVQRMNEIDRDKIAQAAFCKNWSDLNEEELRLLDNPLNPNSRDFESWLCENCGMIQTEFEDDDGKIVTRCIRCDS